MEPSLCFLLSALGPSGGVRVVLEHGRRLAAAHGFDVTIAVESGPTGQWSAPGVRVVSAAEARERGYDVAVATWWRTALSLFEVEARRRAYFVQQLEERVYRPSDVERIGAALSHDLPVAFVTEARWIAELLAELRPDALCRHVPNGVDKELFAAPERPDLAGAGPLRVLVEGSPLLWYKGVPEAAAALGRMSEPHTATLVTPEPPPAELGAAFDRVIGPLPHEAMPAVYAEHDVLVKLSRVEGVFTPPLEAFHMGATCLVWPVTGHDEYVRHAENGAVVDFDDLPGTAAWLDLLARDRGLLARLRRGALETARAWPSWDAAADGMAAALRSIAEAPAPEAAGGAAQLLADVDAAMEQQRLAAIDARRAVERADKRVAALEATRTFRARAMAQRLLASIRR